MRKTSWQVPLTIALVLFGLLVSTQYRTQIALLNTLAYQKSDDLVALVKNLSEKRNRLADEVETLTKTQRSLEEKAETGHSLVASLENELKQLKIITGAVAVEGPGITITITGDSNLMYLDLIDLINELWVTGAEAISVNGQRITSTTVISQAEDENNRLVITVDRNPLLTPVVIKAIGNANDLEKGLTFTGGIFDNFNTLYQVFPVIKKEEKVKIPAVSKEPVYKYLKW